jgi:hypothetical protein
VYLVINLVYDFGIEFNNILAIGSLPDRYARQVLKIRETAKTDLIKAINFNLDYQNSRTREINRNMTNVVVCACFVTRVYS